MLEGKKIILGVTGGIAAYKSAWIVREFIKAGATVQVVMTPAATRFITPLTLSTLSRREVCIEMFPSSDSESSDKWTKHIELALWADCMLVAPASANTIAKIAEGRADNLLTALILALRGPLILSPTMDVDMYLNPITQANIDRLRETGCFVLEPDSGELASGLKGPGRLPEIDRVVGFVDDVLRGSQKDLSGKKILITAGPTREPIDPVRYIGNRSSGRMGFALASAAAMRGAEVTLISGPVSLATPRHVKRTDVETAEQMKKAVEGAFPSADVLIMAAAVADYAPLSAPNQKIKREEQKGDRLTLELIKNPDILKNAGEARTTQLLVGFALETENELENARKKMTAKNLDMVVLNNPTVEGAGFESTTNVVTLIRQEGNPLPLPKMSKFNAANEILNEIGRLLDRRPRQPHVPHERAS